MKPDVDALEKRLTHYLLIGAGDTTDEAWEGNYLAELSRAAIRTIRADLAAMTAERDALKTENNSLGRDWDAMQDSKRESFLGRVAAEADLDALRAQLRDAEAQAAAMKEAYRFVAGTVGSWIFEKRRPTQEEFNAVANKINSAFGSDAGTRLLAERDGLREALINLRSFVTTDKYAARVNIQAMIDRALAPAPAPTAKEESDDERK